MNENINLVEILKDCPKGPKGTELYSPLFGEVTLYKVSLSGEYPISVRTQLNDSAIFTKYGIYRAEYADSECTLFPSKDNRDWSKFQPKKPKFDPKTLKPFDKVLVKDHDTTKWKIEFFSHIDDGNLRCLITSWKLVIPYNDDTKHLVGTSDKAPEFYRYWED